MKLGIRRPVPVAIRFACLALVHGIEPASLESMTLREWMAARKRRFS